jgi:hypothetical protein
MQLHIVAQAQDDEYLLGVTCSVEGMLMTLNQLKWEIEHYFEDLVVYDRNIPDEQLVDFYDYASDWYWRV